MTILDYLEASVERIPNRIAFADNEKAYEYERVWKTACCIGTGLLHEKLGIRRPIAVLIDRNVESICTFFGIVMSRNFYVPIDVSQPLNRIQTILTQMQPAAVISIHHNMTDEIREGITIPVLDYDDLAEVCADEMLLSESRTSMLDTDPLYAICTSGSTGVPKGVLISHRSVMDFIPVFCRTFQFTENEIFGNQAPFDFDVSVKDIYSAIYLGATVYILPKVCFSMPKLLVQTLDEQKITTIIWAVSALCIAAGVNAFKTLVPGSLKKILFSGEVMPIKMLNVWRRALPDAMYVNLYGPTEITCNCMYYVIDRDFDEKEKLPLGQPFENEGVYVLTDDNKPVSVGQTGEICVTGTCLALGYYRNPQKTAESFVQNPLNEEYPEMMYRTGDLAELKEDGNYYFAARKDFQIKHMGHRIELEEIEMHMNAIDGVTRACCLFDTDRNKIVAFYVGQVDKVEVINALKQDLPKYMIPNVYMNWEELPLNKNGKIDRQELKRRYEEAKA